MSIRGFRALFLRDGWANDGDNAALLVRPRGRSLRAAQFQGCREVDVYAPSAVADRAVQANLITCESRTFTIPAASRSGSRALLEMPMRAISVIAPDTLKVYEVVPCVASDIRFACRARRENFRSNLTIIAKTEG